MAGIGRRTISIPRINRCKRANKGHFVVYSNDKRRFVIPLAYLQTRIFRELFRMSEEEFGLPTDGPIILPCNGPLLEYVVYSIQKDAGKNIYEPLLLSLVFSKCLAAASDHGLSPHPI